MDLAAHGMLWAHSTLWKRDLAVRARLAPGGFFWQSLKPVPWALPLAARGQAPLKATLVWPFFVCRFAAGWKGAGLLMGKIAAITRNNDFRRAYRRGKSYVSPLLVTYALKNRLGETRVGITTSKKVGNAVVRSRARRVLREAYRGLAPDVKPGYDLIFVARGRTAGAKSTQVQKHMERQLLAAGLLADRDKTC